MKKRKAFTLFEILAVLALIALLAGLVVIGFSFLDDLGPRPLDAQLNMLVKQVRYDSAESGRQLAVYYDVQTGEFVVSDVETGLEKGRLSIVSGQRARIPEVSFIPVYPETTDNFISVFNMLETLPCLYFFPDSTATPARIEIKTGAVVRTYEVDSIVGVSEAKGK